MSFDFPLEQKTTAEKAQEEQELSRLERQRKRKLSPEDCEGVLKKSRSWMLTVLILSFVVIIPLGYGLYRSTSAVVDINIDLREIDATPIQPIRVDTNLYASSTNATFKPSLLFVGVLYPATDIFFSKEIYLGQFPHRIVSEELTDAMDNLDDMTDYFFSSSFLALNENTTNQLKIRVSADYSIVIKTVVSVDFLNTTVDDRYLGFYYIINHNERNLLNVPIGVSTFQLTNGNTFFFNTTQFIYDYQFIDDFFNDWNTTGDITAYPFILNGTVTNSLNWNNLWGISA